MDKVIEKAKELRQNIDNLPLIKEYQNLKSLIENDEELKRQRNEIARLTSINKLEEKENLLKIYNSHPLISNFEIQKEEVYLLLNEIISILK